MLAEEPTAAVEHLESAMRILQEVGARNEVAKVLVARAALRRASGDETRARVLLERALALFKARERSMSRSAPGRHWQRFRITTSLTLSLEAPPAFDDVAASCWADVLAWGMRCRTLLSCTFNLPQGGPL